MNYIPANYKGGYGYFYVCKRVKLLFIYGFIVKMSVFMSFPRGLKPTLLKVKKG